MNHLKTLRILAILEGISYLMLFGVTMPLKYAAEMPGPNKIVGMIHGVLFIAYCIWVIQAARDHKWSFSKIAWALLASVLPFGTFVADKKLFKNQ
ncbi:MAG: DUF3817 domain-containing protein [Flavobacteriales bacterium]